MIALFVIFVLFALFVPIALEERRSPGDNLVRRVVREFTHDQPALREDTPHAAASAEIQVLAPDPLLLFGSLAAVVATVFVLVWRLSASGSSVPTGPLNLIEMWREMSRVGWTASTVLFVMMLWSIGVAIERLYAFNQARAESRVYAAHVSTYLKDGRLKDAIALSFAKEYRYSHLAKVVLAGLQEYQFQQESASTLSRDDMLHAVRLAIQRASGLTATELNKGVSTLATIGSTAPFVGLLGSVVGIINLFVAVGSTGSGLAGALSAGIAEALVETALGLLVAIPVVWMYNYLTTRLKYFNVEMSNASSEFVDFLIKRTA